MHRTIQLSLSLHSVVYLFIYLVYLFIQNLHWHSLMTTVKNCTLWS